MTGSGPIPGTSGSSSWPRPAPSRQLPPDKRAEVLAGAGAALQEMGGRFTVSMITVAIAASV